MNTSLPVVFNFFSQTLRVVMRDGEPWFAAADVCAALTIGNSRMATDRLDDDEKGVSSIDTPSGQQEMTIVNESGLYSLILGSRKPEAKKFKKWVTSEVLPAIRKTGSYIVTGSTMNETVANMVRQVEAGNGTPVEIFMPLVQAVQQKTNAGKTEPDAKRIAESYQLASALLPQVAEAICSRQGIRHRRWFLSFDYRGNPFIQTIPKDAYVMSIPKLLKTLSGPDCHPLDSTTLYEFMRVCLDRLNWRLHNAENTPKTIAQKRAKAAGKPVRLHW